MERIELIFKLFFDVELPTAERMQFYRDKMYADVLKEVVCYLQPDCREENLQKFFEKLPQKERRRLLKTTLAYCRGGIKDIAKELSVSKNYLFSQICFACAEKVFAEDKLDLKFFATRHYFKILSYEEKDEYFKKYGVSFSNLDLYIEQFLIDRKNNWQVVNIVKKLTSKELGKVCNNWYQEHYFRDMDNPNVPLHGRPLTNVWTIKECRIFKEKEAYLRAICEKEFFPKK